MVGHIAEAGQIMSGALEAFCLVVHKGAVDRPREGWSDWEIVWWYRYRADASENRLKELRSDFGGAHLPSSGFCANAVVLALSAIAYNLPCLGSRCRPNGTQDGPAPSGTISMQWSVRWSAMPCSGS